MNTRALLAASILALLAVAASAEWIATTTEVPVERLLANLTKRVEDHPKDARAHYTLARVHSMAWARGTETVHVKLPDEGEKEALPGFAPYQSVRMNGPKEIPSPERLEHLHLSLRHYRFAAAFDPKAALSLLGLAWSLDDATWLAPRIGLPDPSGIQPVAPEAETARHRAWIRGLGAEDPDVRRNSYESLYQALPQSAPALARARKSEVADIRMRVGRLLVAYWESLAITAYRQAYALTLERDLGAKSLCGHGDSAVSREAGKALVRLLRKIPATDAVKAEIERVEKSVAKLEEKPMWITPVIFPVDAPASLSSLLAGGRVARIDLDGDGESGLWPWVGPNAGILVWNPEGKRDVACGRSLFGSVTWWVSWRNGYEPLAALDDDGDGRLTGPELSGIAVWQDRNGNGRSDPGEAIPATNAGISAIVTRPDGTSGGVPAHGAGIVLRDGSTRPTYDWTPRRIR